MSLGTTFDLQALASVQGAQSKQSVGQSGKQAAPLQAAFQTQLRMAQSLFGEGSQLQGEGSSPGAVGESFIGDAMMMEALTAITQLMRSEAGLPKPVAAAGKTASASVDGNASLANVVESLGLGSLSAKFESGTEGVAAIGYDRVGGTSYGKYQIASKPGTMDRFLSFLDEKAPQWADRLREAGPADTGSKTGSMPEAWQAIAAQDPERFGKLQHEFISGETYAPARDMILKQTGLDFDNAPSALKEVLWSTSVQHGPTGAARIFSKVIDQFVGNGSEGNFNTRLIEGVYDRRMNQFGSSTRRVQQAVADRLGSEKQLALNLLGRKQINRIV